MTTPSILSVAAAAPKAGTTGTPAGGGEGDGRDFASLIAGLVAAAVAGPVGADAKGTADEEVADGSCGEAEAGSATGSDLATTAVSTPAVGALVPAAGPAAALAGAVAEANLRPPSSGATSSVPTADDPAEGTVPAASPAPPRDALSRAVGIPGQTQLASAGTISADARTSAAPPAVAPPTVAPPPVAPPPVTPGRSDVRAAGAAAGGMNHVPGAPGGAAPPVAPPSAVGPVRANAPAGATDSRDGGGTPDPFATVGAAPATPTTPAASTAPTTAHPAATAAQLVAPIAAVHHRGPDGPHTITVDITPDELGPVRIHIELRDGNVELRLAGHNEAARDALRAALPDLKRALEAAGVGTGSFQVSPDNGSGQQQSQPHFGQPQHSANPQNGHARPAWAGPDGRAQHQPEPEPAPMARPVGSLDLQL